MYICAVKGISTSSCAGCCLLRMMSTNDHTWLASHMSTTMCVNGGTATWIVCVSVSATVVVADCPVANWNVKPRVAVVSELSSATFGILALIVIFSLMV